MTMQRTSSMLALLIAFAPLATSSGFAQSSAKSPLANSPALPPAPTQPPPGMLPPSPELVYRAEIKRKGQSMYSPFGLDWIDRTFVTPLRTERTKSPSGVWSLALFYEGHRDAINNAIYWPEQFDSYNNQFKEWQKTYPSSPTGYIMQAFVPRRAVMLAMMKAQKGQATAQDVESAARAFDAHMKSIKSVAASDPHWYVLMLSAHSFTCGPVSEIWTTLKEANNAFPDYLEIYTEAVIAALSCGYSDGARFADQVAELAVERTKTSDGQAMYARLWWGIHTIVGGEAVFADGTVNWPRMKQGMDDVVKRYPDTWNINNFARFACFAKDVAKTRELLLQVNAAPVMQAWGNASNLERCRSWSKAATQ